MNKNKESNFLLAIWGTCWFHSSSDHQESSKIFCHVSHCYYKYKMFTGHETTLQLFLTLIIKSWGSILHYRKRGEGVHEWLAMTCFSVLCATILKKEGKLKEDTCKCLVIYTSSEGCWAFLRGKKRNKGNFYKQQWKFFYNIWVWVGDDILENLVGIEY